MLGFGYSRQTQQTSTRTLYNDGADKVIDEKGQELEVDSSYASFSLRIRLIHTLGLTLGAKTIVPKNEWGDAENNFTFTGGFSWFI